MICTTWNSGVLCASGLLAVTLASFPTAAAASDCDEPGPGWLLCEDFEAGDLGWVDWFEQSPWTECSGCPDGVNDPDRIRLEQDASLAHDGDWSLTTPGTSANYTGGTLRFATCDGEQSAGCTLEGHDELYFRTWVRLAEDHDYVHHFLGLGGSRPDSYWDANGNAGCRPNGERWAGTRVDLNPEHELFFYTYFPGMNCDSGGYCSGAYAEGICDGCANIGMACDDGPECCWGNHFEPEVPVVLPTEQWTCLEMMMRVNTPGESDGAMAFWVNDQLGHDVEGMAWRDVPELQLNRAMLEHYIDADDTDHPNQAWFDDVVVSTQRIGCDMTPGGEDGGTGPAADGDGGDDDGSGGGGTNGGSGSGTDAGADGASVGGSRGASDGTSGVGSGGVDSAGSSDGDDTGCSCRASGSERSGNAAWALLGLGLLAMGRTRQPNRTRC